MIRLAIAQAIGVTGRVVLAVLDYLYPLDNPKERL